MDRIYEEIVKVRSEGERAAVATITSVNLKNIPEPNNKVRIATVTVIIAIRIFFELCILETLIIQIIR